MNSKCAIVSVVHKEKLSDLEELSLKKCVNVFSKKRDIFLIMPEDLNAEYYLNSFGYEFKIVRLKKEYFSSWHSYNWLCKTVDFYRPFAERGYDYVLVHQLDCWCFEDRLDYFMDMNYDYYGGPISAGCWNEREMVGNGGLSLRKVKPFIDAIEKNYENKDKFKAEDLYFCCDPKINKDLKICPMDVALQFAFSADKSETFEFWYKRTNGVLPMGVHNFYKYDALEFWHRFMKTR